MAKLYLFGPSSGLYSCPLAMTDGGARLLEVICNVCYSSTYEYTAGKFGDYVRGQVFSSL